MHYRIAFILPLVLCTVSALHANLANGDPRLEMLYGQFISPCCWKENLLAHHSPKADELRAEIKQRIAAGQSDEQIKTAFTEQFSIRILAEPEGVRGQWLAWTPIAAILVGICVLMLAIRRLRKAPLAVPALEAASLPDLEWDLDSNFMPPTTNKK